LSGGTYAGTLKHIQLTPDHLSVTVASTGYVAADGAAVYAYGPNFYELLNEGRIVSSGGDAIYLASGGAVTNAAGALIAGAAGGIVLEATAGTVSNAGTITGTDGYGVELGAGGTIFNQTGGLIDGYGGVTLDGPGVLTNDGTIEASGGLSVRFGSPADMLVVGTGAQFVGSVSGGGGTLELAAASGTISGLGSGAILSGAESGTLGDFATYMIGPSADWTLTGDATIGMGEALSVLGTLAGSGTLTVAGGPVALGPGAALRVADWQSSGPGSVVDVDAGVAFKGGFAAGGGSVVSIAPGDFLALDGPADFVGATVEGGGVLYVQAVSSLSGLTISGGALLENTGTLSERGGALELGDTAGTVGRFYNTGTLLLTDNDGIIGGISNRSQCVNVGLLEKSAGSSSAVSVSLVDRGRIEILSGTLVLSGPRNSLAGPIAGPGVLALAGGVSTLGVGTSLATGGLSESGTGTSLVVNTDLAYGGWLTQSAGTLDLNGTALTLTGNAGFGGVVAGTGSLVLAAGRDAILSGATLTMASWSITGAHSFVSFAADLTYAGVLDQSAGTLALGGTTLTLDGGGSLAGTVTGWGTLVIGGGDKLLGPGAQIDVSSWSLRGGTSEVATGSSVIYAGSFTDSATTVLDSGGLLILTGQAGFAGATVTGGGVLRLAGSTVVSGLLAGGTVVIQNFGSLVQHGAGLTPGLQASDRVTVENTGTWTLADDGGLTTRNAAAAFFLDRGLFEKTGGSGTSLVSAAVDDTGSIEVLQGTLEFSAGMQGTGTASIGTGAALRFDSLVVSTLSVGFLGSSGDLILDDPVGTELHFEATVSGFGSADAIDLPTFRFRSTTTLGWTQSTETGGVLTITDTEKTARLALDGLYASGNFIQQADGGVGTLIRFQPAAAQLSRSSARAAAAGGPIDGRSPGATLAARIAGFAPDPVIDRPVPVAAGDPDPSTHVFARPEAAVGIRLERSWHDPAGLAVLDRPDASL
jgi:hypothetical protein